MSYNLAELSQKDKDKMAVDQAASGVAFKERYNMPVIPAQVEDQQPEHLREYFRDRVKYYREVSKTLGRMEYTPPEKR
ncbi:DNA polymerase III subunit theta [Yersinia enterocolitica]|uniref:DNA polymerase III subunit theta n=1 Tax=Yersinia enterocolitica TaxID=630 RepID=UPI0005DB1F03|nr:DNA polymerase III subunit theta [Yersinia enterocolitica]EKN3461457.1 DNA polymerase III subunit theta [Yersinia enterocolitica]EKN4157343.1 DNA polymerase III subunit theta [Yersinia enterocolitica]EKN4753719.1 DNA polymerase III subunit theta [Yersinia enterocolitica]EKN6244601.1 DNA polymerase III subunit theta [Yersinia enterocolitica]EKN6253612.1 DNA polymerase III subunit theta [Yersinia enterocolitica]